MQEIKSIKQIAEELRRARYSLDCKLAELNVSRLAVQDDLTRRDLSLDDILAMIPSEDRLKDMANSVQASSLEQRASAMAHYSGDYRLIQQAADNFQSLKSNAEVLYYLAAQLDLPKMANPLQGIDPASIRLQSYRLSQQDSRQSRHERNMISQAYLYKQKHLHEDELSLLGECDSLSPQDALLSVSFYDSLNGEKQHEFVVLAQQTLLDLALHFYCLIAKLQQEHQSKLEGKLDSMLEDSSQAVSSKAGSSQAVSSKAGSSRPSANSFFLIEEDIYYHGRADEVINSACSNAKHSFKYEMGKTSFNSLRVVFGRAYLYRHLGGCDHMLIFKDLRLYEAGSLMDPPRKQKYPFVAFESKMKRRKCDSCKNRFSTVVALGDDSRKGKAYYLCGNCKAHLYGNSHRSEHVTFIDYLHD